MAAIHDLECRGVRKRFGAFVAVDGVSFGIPSGSFFSILGPSGCGKTTLLRMIAGFEEPSEGDILIKGRSVLSLAPNRRNVKLVFQHLALFPMMNVAENIAYGLRCKGVARGEIARRTADVLERVGLPHAGSKDIGQLSGGQKQRIAIARCMVLDPDVLLLDEPLGALDLKLREQMKIELKMLQSQFGTTFVYITHDQSEALVMSDRVAVMNHGRFEQVGAPRELYHDPVTAFVAGFVGDSNRWPGRVLDRDPAGVRVETDSGLTLAACEAGGVLRRGDAVEVFVRPESISVTGAQATDATDATDGSGEHNRQAGRIEGTLFNGANSRILVRTSTGEQVEADLPQRGPDIGFENGAPVVLAWERTGSKCFARAGEDPAG
ncbi:MAG: ABC transporter ATP-binding protein [Immundisolibacterales bacterium]|nr:ABC transporter ATP-binding protein [Immundisolibacterales bacterium]